MSLDSELLNIAKTEQLTLEGNNGLIRRAKENSQSALSSFMTTSGINQSDLSLRNVNTPVFLNDRTVQYAGFAQVLVSGETETNWSLLKQWVAARTLRMIYQAAANRNTDRYKDRFADVQDQLSTEIWPKFRKFGLPIVINPLPAPGAIMERAGEFSPGNVTLINGPGTSNDEIDVAITWVSSGENNESYRSRIVSVTLSSGKVLSVSLNGLIPPDGSQPAHTRASCRYATRVAIGWNVYAGRRGGTLYRQNISPISLSSAYISSGNLNYSGTPVGLGQYADINLVIETNLRRC